MNGDQDKLYRAKMITVAKPIRFVTLIGGAIACAMLGNVYMAFAFIAGAVLGSFELG